MIIPKPPPIFLLTLAISALLGIESGRTAPGQNHSILLIGDDKSHREESAKRKALEKKLRTIILPKVSFQDTPLRDALQFIEQQSKILDTAKHGVKIQISVPEPTSEGNGFGFEGGGGSKSKAYRTTEIPVTLRLTDSPLGEVLRYTTNISQLMYTVKPDGVHVVPLGYMGDPYADRRYFIPPSVATDFSLPADLKQRGLRSPYTKLDRSFSFDQDSGILKLRIGWQEIERLEQNLIKLNGNKPIENILPEKFFDQQKPYPTTNWVYNQFN